MRHIRFYTGVNGVKMTEWVLKLRPIQSEQDAAFVRRLYEAEYPAPVPSAEAVLKAHRIQLAEADDGTLLGLSTCTATGFLWVAVEQAARRQRVGTALLNEATAYAREQGATQVTTRFYDDDAAGLAFCEHFGFTPTLHMVNLDLDLSTWDGSASAVAAMDAMILGVTAYKTYADFEDNDTTRQRLYTLNKALNATIPRDQPQPFVDFETYVNTRILPSAYEGIFLALKGEEWIGMSQITLREGFAFQEMTGVLPEYRGRGIAHALKGMTVTFARKQGLRWVRTFNDVTNPAMIAVNEKVGYVRVQSWHQMRRAL